MKRAFGHIALGRLAALLLAVLLTAGLAPVPVRAEPSAHFTDVPSSHWAHQYVERAYADGAIVGTGGDPANGRGTFSPGSDLTYGQFISILVRAFYPEELAQANTAGPWYAPALRVALDHELTFIEEDQLMERAERAINRYHASYIIVKLLQDKGYHMPSKQERDAAAARIADWSTMAESTWSYYAATAYATGIISGVDSAGTFAGTGSITRDAAAVIYARLSEKIPQFSLVKGEGWALIPDPDYWKDVEETFRTVYPRLWARWGGGVIQKSVTAGVQPDLGDAWMWTRYLAFHDATQVWERDIEIDAGNKDLPPASSFAHELGHVVQSYAVLTSGWWNECMADYSDFRYRAWADQSAIDSFNLFQSGDTSQRDWSFQAYGGQWFFAWMDQKYPTTPQGYGLIDSIHWAMRTGEITSDDVQDPRFNAVVKRITGYDTITALHQQYLRELDTGAWTFNGFAGYADNYITEDLPNVPDPTYPTVKGLDLCIDAYTYNSSGQASKAMEGNNLVDGDRTTKWQAAKEDVTKSEMSSGIQHAISINLGRTMTFDTYSLYHEGSQGDSQKNTVSWRLYYYNSQTKDWVKFDEVRGNTQDVTTRTVQPVTSQYVWLDILDASGDGDGTVRLYELELYDNR